MAPSPAAGTAAFRQHPEADARLGEELRAALGGRPPAVTDLPALRCTEMVVTESMRLYLRHGTGGGETDRGGRTSHTGLPRFAYFPFGGGPRQCIGRTFATMESILILAAIAQRFRLALTPGQREPDAVCASTVDRPWAIPGARQELHRNGSHGNLRRTAVKSGAEVSYAQRLTAEGDLVSEHVKPGFLDTVATAFLRRRLHSRRLRAAAVRGLKVISAGAGGGLQMDFDHSASYFAKVPPWLAAHTSELAAAPAPPTEPQRVPSLSIVVMVVGSRGDVQPFIPIGRRLAERHRVRIATHREFRPMVEQAGLGFYPLAGNPHELMEYIVKTGGSILPTRVEQIWEDVPKKRAMIAEILASTWRACTDGDPEEPDARPFRADAIVANPPSYGHIHCAEALHIPLHMIFTMPWSATCAFPHPFARIDPTTHRPVENFFSYGIIDLLVWAGIGDLVDVFRMKTLGLPPLGLTDGAALLDDHEVPFTYLWPASLVAKPKEWGPHIDLANFIHYEQAQTYEPPQALLDFLAAGEAPIYIGFGSVVAEDPAALTRIIIAALEKAGARGIVSEGWAHLGGEVPPANVYVIGDCPHDWLFARCRAVCHHGGAGTTAAGLCAGLPTVVVPFFGDQVFWGRIVADAGAGPEPIPIRRLDRESLTAAFDACRRPQIRERASELGARLRAVDGVELAVQSVERHLPAPAMCCSSDPDHLAVVYCDTCGVRLCGDCCRRAHSGHVVHPYRYVDWGGRPPHGLVGELGELIGDAAQALQAGLAELLPSVKSGHHGVVFSDGDETPGADSGGPARKLRRWLGSR